MWKNFPFFKTYRRRFRFVDSSRWPGIVTNFQNKEHPWYAWLRFQTRKLETFCETFAPLIRFSYDVVLVAEFIVVLRLKLLIIFINNENN